MLAVSESYAADIRAGRRCDSSDAIQRAEPASIYDKLGINFSGTLRARLPHALEAGASALGLAGTHRVGAVSTNEPSVSIGDH
jgi:hypothetical protein